MDFGHRPVMPAEVIEYLGCSGGGTYVDGTVGGAGHAAAILGANPANRLIGVDRDEDALRAAGEALKPFAGRFELVKGNFRDLKGVLGSLAQGPVDGVLLDIGVSSYQLESPERGFSFLRDGALDMRMDRSQSLSAAELVGTLEPWELERVFKDYGEEAHARRIARAIVKARAERPIDTTAELARVVWEAVPPWVRRARIHPATRVFQALRIAVNDELGSLADGLTAGLDSLRPGGRMVVISFHSLEDRMVKVAFRQAAAGCVCPPRLPMCVCGKTPTVRLLTRRAVAASDAEVENNPRSRSARLRAVEKL